MIQTKEYNNVNPTFLKTSKKIGVGEVVSFKALGATKTKNGKVVNRNRSVCIPQTDTIYDGKNFVQIAPVVSLNQGKPKMVPIFFESTQLGLLVLNGSSNVDRIVFDYLWNSNYNESNPKRDTTVTPLFKFNDPQAQAQEEWDVFDLKTDALLAVKQMSDKDAIDFAISRGQNVDWSPIQAKKFLAKIADRNPKEFLKLAKSQDKTIKATIIRAQEKGIIGFNKTNSSFFFKSTNTSFKTVERGADPVDSLTNWCITTKPGQQVYGEITNAVEEQLSKTKLKK